MSKPTVFDTLRTMILDGAFSPGDRITEAELTRRFGISRTPVREALRRLEAQGLLVHEPHRGVVVASLDPGAVAELYVMREILDGAAAALAARHATDTEIDAMGRQVARDRSIAGDPERLAASNRAFHAAVHLAAHNRFLVKAAQALAEALALLGPTTLSVPGRAAVAIEEHGCLVAALRDRDPERARQAAGAHIRAAFAARLSQMDARMLEEADRRGTAELD